MKKLNKWIAGLLCMMLVITMVAGLGVTEVKADDAVTTVSSWTELKNAISKGGNIQLGNDIVAETGNSAIYVSNTVTVDLAGHTIDRGCIKATWNGNTFTVSGGDLTIKDTSAAQAGQITGGYNDNNCGGGCIYVDSGILRLESGILTGNKCEDVDANGVDRGGAVGVRSGTFIMTRGEITDNTCDAVLLSCFFRCENFFYIRSCLSFFITDQSDTTRILVISCIQINTSVFFFISG